MRCTQRRGVRIRAAGSRLFLILGPDWKGRVNPTSEWPLNGWEEAFRLEQEERWCDRRKEGMKQKAACRDWCVINAASWGVFTLIGAGHYSGIAAYRCRIGLHATVASHTVPPPPSKTTKPSNSCCTSPRTRRRWTAASTLWYFNQDGTATARGSTERRKTTTQISVRGTGLDGAIMRTRRIAGHFGSTSGPDEAESCCSSGEFTN